MGDRGRGTGMGTGDRGWGTGMGTGDRTGDGDGGQGTGDRMGDGDRGRQGGRLPSALISLVFLTLLQQEKKNKQDGLGLRGGSRRESQVHLKTPRSDQEAPSAGSTDCRGETLGSGRPHPGVWRGGNGPAACLGKVLGKMTPGLDAAGPRGAGPGEPARSPAGSAARHGPGAAPGERAQGRANATI